MSWHKISTGLDEWLKDNQGCINSKVENMFFAGDKNLKAYTDTLTQDQRDIARKHLVTVIGLKAKKDELRDNNKAGE